MAAVPLQLELMRHSFTPLTPVGTTSKPGAHLLQAPVALQAVQSALTVASVWLQQRPPRQGRRAEPAPLCLQSPVTAHVPPVAAP